MTRSMIALSFGVGAMLLAADHAFAQGANAQGANCAPHATVIERLADRFGESRQSIGLSGNNAVVEVFASLTTGTWTIAVTQPGGQTCLVASGEAFQVLAEALPNTDAPA
jgi:hypothetical protein